MGVIRRSKAVEAREDIHAGGGREKGFGRTLQVPSRHNPRSVKKLVRRRGWTLKEDVGRPFSPRRNCWGKSEPDI